MYVTLELEITDPEIADAAQADLARFRRRIQQALANAWPYAPMDAVRVARVRGCTCASGNAGDSCTLDCKAPCWSKP